MKPILIPAAALAAAIGLFTGGCSPPSNYELADKDGDGNLSNEETEKALLRTILAIGDSNRDGKISIGEYRAVDPDYPESRFVEQDRDGDRLVTPEELDHYAEVTDVFDRLIASIDANGDGEVDRAEADAFNARLEAAEGDNAFLKLDRLNADLGDDE